MVYYSHRHQSSVLLKLKKNYEMRFELPSSIDTSKVTNEVKINNFKKNKIKNTCLFIKILSCN